MSNMTGVVVEAGTAYPSRALWYTVGFLVGSVLLIFLLVFWVFFPGLLSVLVLCLVRPMSLISLDCPFLITLSVFFITYQHLHCRQRAPVGIVLSSSGTSQLGMFDIQTTTKCKYYDHIVLLYLESRRCRYRSIIFACLYLYVSVVNLIDYSDIDKMMDINNEKC
jgi:hypothetical protein